MMCIRHRSQRVLTSFVAILSIVAVASLQSFAVDPPAAPPPPIVDLYLFAGEWPIWIGTTISYTVYEPVRVEARVLSASGEIIVVFPEGIKQPGRYTLPFNGNYRGAQYAGYYTFELYFGDDFAAKYQMAAIPASSAT